MKYKEDETKTVRLIGSLKAGDTFCRSEKAGPLLVTGPLMGDAFEATRSRCVYLISGATFMVPNSEEAIRVNEHFLTT